MKLNLENFKQDISYDKNLNYTDERIIIDNYINKYDEIYYDSFLKDEYSISRFSELSKIGNSILNWYEFKKTDKVLELGSKLGNLTSMLCEKCEYVTSIEFSKKRGEAIAKRLKDIENLELIIGDLVDLNIENSKYDYVTIIGFLEYAPIFFKQSKNPYLELLLWAKSKLKPDGKILLALNNSLGVQYLVGGSSSENDAPFNKIYNNSSNYFTRTGIQKLLNEANLENFKFYYPLPNYEISNVIFSDDYEITENSSKIMYNVVYNNNSSVIMDELKLFKKLVRNGLFKEFTNSFLIEINLSNIRNDVNFISYNNLRQNKYRLCLTLTNKYAKKKIDFKEAKVHIEQYFQNIKELKNLGFELLDDIENDYVISEFCKKIQYDDYLIELLQKENEQAFYESINNWFEQIKQKLLIEENFIENKAGLNIVKKAYIDLVFENTFIDNGKYIFYDQEWMLENTPIEFILYRAVNNLYLYNNSKINISLENILEKLNINQYIDIFGEIEKEFQNKVIDNYLLNFFSRPYTFKRDIEELEKLHSLRAELTQNENLKIELAQNRVLLNEYMQKINDLKINLEEKLTELNNELKNSKTEKIQKIIEYLRTIE